MIGLYEGAKYDWALAFLVCSTRLHAMPHEWYVSLMYGDYLCNGLPDARCNTVNWLCVFLLWKANVAVSKSRHRLFFYPIRKGGKEQERPYFRFLGSGGTLYKGKVLAPFVSMVIHGLLIAGSLILFFLSEKVLVNGLEKVLKREFNFVMILVWMYTKYLSRLILKTV